MGLSAVLTRDASRRLGVACALLAVGGIWSPQARAAEFDVKPKYSQSFELDPNPLLAPAGGKTLYGTVFMPEVTLSRDTADSSISMDTRLDLSRYNLEKFSSSDVHSTIAGKKSWEVSYFTMSGKLDYDTTRSSEFTNSGVNVAGIRHTGFSLAPEYGISLDSRNTFVLDGSASTAVYGDSRIYQNYVTYGLSPTLEHAFDVKDVGELILQTSHYNTTSGFRNSANTIGPAVGWKRQMTPSLSFNASGGYQMVKIDVAGLGTSTQYQSFYSVDVTYKQPRDSFDLTSSRQVQPQSSGRLITATTFGLSGSHFFTRGITDTVYINYQTSDYTTPLPGNETSFLEASNKVSYQLAKRWVIQPSLRYRREGRVGNYAPAESEALIVTLAFTPPEINFQ